MCCGCGPSSPCNTLGHLLLDAVKRVDHALNVLLAGGSVAGDLACLDLAHVHRQLWLVVVAVVVAVAVVLAQP